MAREFRRGVFRPLLAAGLLGAALLSVPAGPAAADWLAGEHALTRGNAIRQWPSVSGHRVAYADHRNDRTSAGVATFDIRVLDLSSGRDQLLTPAHTATGKASLSGDTVVWPDAGNGTKPGIWLADLTSGASRRLAVHPGDHVALSGSRLCYEFGGRVWVSDLGTGRDVALSPSSAIASDCDISGPVVVWQDDRNGNFDIYARNLTTDTELALTTDAADQSMPRVDGDDVVWQDATNGPGNFDVAAFDLRTGVQTRVTVEPGSQWLPDVSDGRVVWMDERFGHGNTEVFAYDLASGIETRVTTSDGWSGNPAISGGRIVYEDVSGGGHNLYQRALTAPRLSLTLAAGPEGGLAAVAGVLTGVQDVPVVGANLLLETSTDGRVWQPRGYATTAGDGSYSFLVPELRGSGWVRVRAPGSPEYAEAVSSTFRLQGVGIVANPPR